MIISLTSAVKTYNLKLKPSYKGSIQASGWDLHTDTDTYPILKSANEKNFHLKKLLVNLSNIKLESEKLNDIQNLWKSINTTSCSTLVTDKGLRKHQEGTSTYNIKDIITPTMRYTLYAIYQVAYEHFTKIIRDYITKKENIYNEKSPNTF